MSTKYPACTWEKGRRRPVRPLGDRFWEKVQKSEGCWIWKAAVLKSGYGTINLRRGTKKTHYAHRIAWELTRGPIPDGLLVLHKCDVMLCVRPEHLYLGDYKQNAADIIQRDRRRLARVTRATQSEPTLREEDVRCAWRRVRGSLPRPVADRFWEKVQKSEACWLWMGGTMRNGYGSFSVPSGSGRRMCYPHRMSWELANGPIPKGLWVLHRCDVRRCVRPDHLFLGDRADNMADMVRKGRQGGGGPRGEKHGRAKLVNYQVRTIMALLGVGKPQRAIAEHYGVSISVVSLINKGRHYTDVTLAGTGEQ